MAKESVRGVATALLLMATVMGCGDSGPCAPLEGTYRLDIRRVSGDCGLFEPSIVRLGGADDTYAECEGGRWHSEDGCSTEVDYYCPLYDGPDHIGYFGMVGAGHVSPSGLTAEATIELSVHDLDGYLVCRGIYEVTWTKL
jgi:hypothetical protein